ncbi:MAG: acylphosphatase [Lewinellaceae bacterium]|nr:acylphosphatase [Lewinellaceae bacterium]
MHPTTYHLHLTGQVQGVGFRPYVWRIARQWGLYGWVNNSADGVHIVFNATADTAHDFAAAVIAQAPVLSRITGQQLSQVTDQVFTTFAIVPSDEAAIPDLLITPDFALCAACRKELHDDANRRHQYPL